LPWSFAGEEFAREEEEEVAGEEEGETMRGWEERREEELLYYGKTKFATIVTQQILNFECISLP